MREDERCEHCEYRRLELVPGAQHDAALSALETAGRWSVACLPMVRAVAEAKPAKGEWQQEFLSAQLAARETLRELGPQPSFELEEPEPEVIWRCHVCGAVDAPQECLGICIWQRFDWVSADTHAAVLADARNAAARAQALTGLLRLLAGTQPRADTWKRNWRALNERARALMAGGDELSATA